MNNDVKIGSILSIALALSCAGFFTSCTSMSPTNIKPVESFEIQRYLGDWYEIGRFDFKWEKDMKNVLANYSMNENGSIKVTNSGYDYVYKKQKQSIGKAKFATSQTDIANLKVSFFGPFYSAYTVIALDSDYQYALVAGANKDLLWILSRTKTMPEEIRKKYVQIAESAGYNLEKFVWTIQE